MRRLLHLGDDARPRGPRARLRRAHRARRAAAARRRSPRTRWPRVGGAWEDREEELFGPDEALHAAFTELRDELLRDVPRVAGTLGELRLDTDLEVTHGVVRYLELVKLAALINRTDAPAAAPTRWRRSTRCSRSPTTAQQREVLEIEPARRADPRRRARRARPRRRRSPRRGEPSLEAFLPRRGEGLRAQRLGHRHLPDVPAEVQVRARLPDPERADAQPAVRHRRPPGARALPPVRRRARSTSCSACSTPAGGAAGFGAGDEERQLRAKAEAALRRYEERRRTEDGEPVWFERSFTFRLGPHTLRGRVDRVDRLPDGGYELIDYKTGRPKSEAQLRDDVQLALYALAAREAWDVESAGPVLLLRARRREGAAARRRRRRGRGSARRCSRSPTASRARASSRRRATPRARSATTGSPARRPSAEALPSTPWISASAS